MDPNTLLHKPNYFYISHPALLFYVGVSDISYQLNFISNPCLDSLFPFSHSQIFSLFFYMLHYLLSVTESPPFFLLSFFFFFFYSQTPCQVQFLKKRIIHWGFLHSLYPPKELAFLISLLHLITLHSPTTPCF